MKLLLSEHADPGAWSISTLQIVDGASRNRAYDSERDELARVIRGQLAKEKEGS